MKNALPHIKRTKSAAEPHFELLPRTRLMETKIIPIEKITADIKAEDKT